MFMKLYYDINSSERGIVNVSKLHLVAWTKVSFLLLRILLFVVNPFVTIVNALEIGNEHKTQYSRRLIVTSLEYTIFSLFDSFIEDSDWLLLLLLLLVVAAESLSKRGFMDTAFNRIAKVSVKKTV